MLLLIAFLGCGKKPELPTVTPEVPKTPEVPETPEIVETPETLETPKLLTVEAISITKELAIELDSSSVEVRNISAYCGDYRQEQAVADGKVVFKEVPEGACQLKFDPTGGLLSDIQAGSSLKCVVTSESVNCE